MAKSERPQGHHPHQHPASAHLRAAADAMDKHHTDLMNSLPPEVQAKLMGGGGQPQQGGGVAQVLSPLGGGAV